MSPKFLSELSSNKTGQNGTSIDKGRHNNDNDNENHNKNQKKSNETATSLFENTLNCNPFAKSLTASLPMKNEASNRVETLLAGRYKILSRAGAGTYGCVFEGIDTQDDLDIEEEQDGNAPPQAPSRSRRESRVAIKTILACDRGDDTAAKRVCPALASASHL